MEVTSIRLSSEITRKLLSEAQKLSETAAQTITVSDLIRACIAEKFPQICTRIKSERAALSALQEEVSALGDRVANLEEDVRNLVSTLREILPLLATREQIDDLTDAIAEAIKAVRER